MNISEVLWDLSEPECQSSSSVRVQLTILPGLAMDMSEHFKIY
jgi:hypothetical protein